MSPNITQSHRPLSGKDKSQDRRACTSLEQQKMDLYFFCPLYHSLSEPFSEKVKAITLPIKAMVPSGPPCQLVK